MLTLSFLEPLGRTHLSLSQIARLFERFYAPVPAPSWAAPTPASRAGLPAAAHGSAGSAGDAAGREDAAASDQRETLSELAAEFAQRVRFGVHQAPPAAWHDGYTPVDFVYARFFTL